MTTQMTLHDYRIHLAYSQESLAKAAKVERHTIGRIELAQHAPRAGTKRKLAAVLGLQPYQILWPVPKRDVP